MKRILLAATLVVAALVTAIWQASPRQQLKRAIRARYQLQTNESEERMLRYFGTTAYHEAIKRLDRQIIKLVGTDGLAAIDGELRWINVLKQSDLLDMSSRRGRRDRAVFAPNLGEGGWT